MNSRDPAPPPAPVAGPTKPPRRCTALGILGMFVGLALVAGSAVLFYFDPAHNGFYPRCQLYQMTGLQCPGCGGLRALHALLHGQVVAAFKLNSLAVVALPVAAAWAAAWWVRRRRDPTARLTMPTKWLWIGVAIIVVFGVARNLSFRGWFGS